ncbi:MAG: hypothetical protein E6151_04945, partial [Dialister micraerophilus]|nr:hypothetical protein [Dialister micraerophilus]
EKFFKNAMNIINKDKMKILRISDFNTKGLMGADEKENKDTAWGRLVKGSGISNQDKTAGGSFGIGKSVPFGCSDIRTIFYASKDINCIESCIGVTRLVTFPYNECKDISNPRGLTTGMGYYSEDLSKNAIFELPSFEDGYIRNETGTDLYIMCMSDQENLVDKLIENILDNFMISLWKEKLIVNIKTSTVNKIINKENIGVYIKELENKYRNENVTKKKFINNIKNYYDLLCLPKSENVQKIFIEKEFYGEKYKFNSGEAYLYVMKIEGGNRRIMITRQAGMKLFELDRMPCAIPDFTGILYIVGDRMNAEFRCMETPEHNKWVSTTTKCKGKEKYYDSMEKDLKRYVRETVKKLFNVSSDEVIDAYGAADFLPDISEENLEKGKKSKEYLVPKSLIIKK